MYQINLKTTNIGRDVVERKPHSLPVRNVISSASMGNSVEIFPKMFRMQPSDPHFMANTALNINLEDIKTPIFTAVVSKTVMIRKTTQMYNDR